MKATLCIAVYLGLLALLCLFAPPPAPSEGFVPNLHDDDER